MFDAGDAVSEVTTMPTDGNTAEMLVEECLENRESSRPPVRVCDCESPIKSRFSRCKNWVGLSKIGMSEMGLNVWITKREKLRCIQRDMASVDRQRVGWRGYLL